MSACTLGAKRSTWVIRYQELFKIRWCLTVKGLVGEEEDFKLSAGFHREPMQRSKHRGDVIFFLFLINTLTAEF